MKHGTWGTIAAVSLLILHGTFNTAFAQRTANRIVIGQSVELSGAATGKENTQGARAYFDWINSQGGVHGRMLELRTYDDQRDPEITRRNTEKLLREDGAVALFGYRSTPTVEAVLALVKTEKVALVAPFTGAMSVRDASNPYLFHLRASYHDEAAKMVEIVRTLQIQRVALVSQNDAFGRDGLAGFEHHLGAAGLTPVASARYERKNPDIEGVARELVQARPHAVMLACSPLICVDIIKRVRALGAMPQFMLLSNVNSDEFFAALGPSGRGVGVTQVMPYPRDLGAAVVREFLQVLKSVDPPPPPSYAALEGFVAAKLIVEALRRAGPHPGRPQVVEALTRLGELDLGGVTVRYSPTSKEASRFVELTVVGQNGFFWR